MSILQGGSGFPFFSNAVYNYISCGKYTNIEVDLKDIPDETLKMAIGKVIIYFVWVCMVMQKEIVCLLQIKRAEDSVQLKAVLAIDEVQDLLLQTGFRKPVTLLAIADKEVLSAIIDFHFMAKVKCVMDQFMEGLKAVGLLAKIQLQPAVWEPMFVHCNSHDITTGTTVLNHVCVLVKALLFFTDNLKSLLKVLFVEKGCNQRANQEQAYIHFMDFLDECSGIIIAECLIILLF